MFYESWERKKRKWKMKENEKYLGTSRCFYKITTIFRMNSFIFLFMNSRNLWLLESIDNSKNIFVLFHTAIFWFHHVSFNLIFLTFSRTKWKYVVSSIRKSSIWNFSPWLLSIENFPDWKAVFSHNEFILSKFTKLFISSPEKLIKQHFRIFQTTSQWIQKEINDQNDGKTVCKQVKA